MADIKLTATPRENLKKGATNALRREGNVPGVYYFHQQEPRPFFVDKKDLKRALHASAKIYELNIGSKSHHAVVKHIQHDPITDEIIHIDFMGVNLNEVINIVIPVHLTGSDVCVGVKESGGMVEQHAWELEIKCKASAIPEKITVDVAALKLGESILVRDLKIENAEIVTSATAPIVSVIIPAGVGKEEEAATEETAE